MNAIYIANGDKYTFGDPTNQIFHGRWPITGLTNGVTLGDALEEFSRVANVTFEYVTLFERI